MIFLTARDDPADLRNGFTRGGDDYVTKPFCLEELDDRIQAILRRTTRRDEPGHEVLSCADLRMDTVSHEVTRGEGEIELSPTEFRLLRYLLANRGRVLSKAQILDHVWQYDFDGDGSVVETYISYLRKKVDKGRAPPDPHRCAASATRSESPRRDDDQGATDAALLQRLLDRVDELGRLGLDLGAEARDDLAVGADQELLEVPPDVAGCGPRRRPSS